MLAEMDTSKLSNQLPVPTNDSRDQRFTHACMTSYDKRTIFRRSVLEPGVYLLEYPPTGPIHKFI